MIGKENAAGAAIGWLTSQEDAMRDLLAELVNIDSGSDNLQGVDAVGERFARFFESQSVPFIWHSDAVGRVALHARSGSESASESVLLMGHRDTVFKPGEAARRPFTVKGTRAYGPGVADMKAGLVMNAFVLAAFHRHSGLIRPLAGVFTADEEIGSPRSRADIERLARGAHAVFNAEPGRGDMQRKAEALARIEAIREAADVPGTRSTMDCIGEFDPFCTSRRSQHLFEIYRNALERFGQHIAGEYSGGCADSGITSQMGCPTLCAVGPVGGKFHTEDEYLELASIMPRTLGLALAIGELQDDGSGVDR